MGYYTPLSGRPRSSSSTSARGQRSASAPSPAAQEKAAEAQRLLDALQAITDLPRREFPAAEPGVPPPLPEVDARAILRRHAQQARAGVSVFDRAARRTARVGARAGAETEVRSLEETLAQRQLEWQREIEGEWRGLRANEPRIVLSRLASAFEDNQAAAAAVGVLHEEVSLIAVVPGVEVVPERKPTTTAKGNLSLKKLTKRETADVYKLVVCGHVLATLKECFATAPGISSARIVAVRAAGHGDDGRRRPEAVMAARVSRSALAGVRWQSVDAAQILSDAASELVATQRGVSKELQPLDVTQQPDLGTLLDAVDFDEMTGQG
ncbi:hypothetical protein G7072_10940 [Nocardioides sp. HDW12B]|uniref:hypothetical protein n=1 Tax=Nocardioides sp. HDW12B TaxID=2714939 RepID=UPI00140DF31B|nr:hypothetical protein [Nocardioides sp. HDW12B]QIK66785.1 hypothetical protein G7072_10940 [Nocardioides sp. HDW12B]